MWCLTAALTKFVSFSCHAMSRNRNNWHQKGYPAMESLGGSHPGVFNFRDISPIIIHSRLHDWHRLSLRHFSCYSPVRASEVVIEFARLCHSWDLQHCNALWTKFPIQVCKLTEDGRTWRSTLYTTGSIFLASLLGVIIYGWSVWAWNKW